MKYDKKRVVGLLVLATIMLSVVGAGAAVAQNESSQFVGDSSNPTLCKNGSTAADNAGPLVGLLKIVLSLLLLGSILGGTIRAVLKATNQTVGMDDDGRGDTLEAIRRPIALAVLVPLLLYSLEFIIGFVFSVEFGCIFP